MSGIDPTRSSAVSLKVDSPMKGNLSLQQSKSHNGHIAHTASAEATVSPAITLKGLAHASQAKCQEAIGSITKELMETSRIATPYISTGIALQRSADFADQGQAKTWSLRVLCWLTSVVTLPVLGLSKLIAPQGEFADSLSRYLFGSDTNVDRNKLDTFDQLFGKLNELHHLALENPDLNREVKSETVRNEIFKLILELGPKKEISREKIESFMLKDLTESLQGNSLSEEEEYIPSNKFLHKRVNFDSITDVIFNQENPIFPTKPSCYFELDLFRGGFDLTIGDQLLESPEKGRDRDEFKKETRQFVLKQIDQLARKNNLDRVDVLKNFLKTYTGQFATGMVRKAVIYNTSLDGHGPKDSAFCDPGMTDHIPTTIIVADDGSCHVSYEMTFSKLTANNADQRFPIPCQIAISFAYISSLDDYQNEKSPHAMAVDCSGHYLDVFSMTGA